MDTFKSPYLDDEALELEVLDEENGSSTKQPYSPFLTHEFMTEDDLTELEQDDEDWSENELDDKWDAMDEVEEDLDEEEYYDEDESFFEEEDDEYYDDYEEIEDYLGEEDESYSEEEFDKYEYDEEIEDELAWSWKGIADKAKHIRDLVVQNNTARDVIKKGEQDENKITDAVFYVQYPSKEGKKLKRNGPLVKKWLDIRKNIVRPILRIIKNNKNYGSGNAADPISKAYTDINMSIVNLINEKGKAINTVYEEVKEKDPPKGSLSENIFVQLGLFALNVATAGFASRITDHLDDGAVKEMYKAAISSIKDIKLQTAIVKKLDHRNEISKSPRIAFFISQQLYLGHMLKENSFLRKFDEINEDIFMSVDDKIAELKRIEEAIDIEASKAFKIQKESTTAQWCTLLATSSNLGVINDRLGQRRETNLLKAVNSIAKWPVTGAHGDRTEYDGVLYLFLKPWNSGKYNNSFAKVSYDLNSSTRFQLYAARIDGANQNVIDTIQTMDLWEMKIPMVVTLRMESDLITLSTPIEVFRAMTFASFGRNENGSKFVEKRKTDGNTLEELSKSVKSLVRLSEYNYNPHMNDLDAIEIAKKSANEILLKTIGGERRDLTSLTVKLLDW